jgi:hypothetical protein
MRREDEEKVRGREKGGCDIEVPLLRYHSSFMST